MPAEKPLVPVERIEKAILLIRGQRVMLDVDLASLYGVSTKALNQGVKRNQTRFPLDFVFRLTNEEKNEVVTICDHLSRLRFSHVLPSAFTEHAAIMLANVLNSDRAVEVSVQVVRAFVRLRETLSLHKELAAKLAELERKIEGHDTHIRSLFEAMLRIRLYGQWSQSRRNQLSTRDVVRRLRRWQQPRYTTAGKRPAITAAELAARLPSVLDSAFKGEL